MGIVVGLLVAVLPPAYLLASAGWVWSAPGSFKAWAALGLSALINVLIAAVHGRTVRHLDLPAVHVVLLPVSAAMYIAAAAGSAWQHHFRGGNTWKGRRYGREMLLTAVDDKGEAAAGVP